MHASDVAKLRPVSSKKTSSRDRSRGGHANVASSPSQSAVVLAANRENVAVSSVLPHIAQIWPPSNNSVESSSLQNGSDATATPLVTRFVCSMQRLIDVSSWCMQSAATNCCVSSFKLATIHRRVTETGLLVSWLRIIWVWPNQG